MFSAQSRTTLARIPVSAPHGEYKQESERTQLFDRAIENPLVYFLPSPRSLQIHTQYITQFTLGEQMYNFVVQQIAHHVEHQDFSAQTHHSDVSGQSWLLCQIKTLYKKNGTNVTRQKYAFLHTKRRSASTHLDNNTEKMATGQKFLK